MARITGIQWYYQVIFTVFLFLIVYTAVFVDTFGEDKCIADSQGCPASMNTTDTTSTSTASTSDDSDLQESDNLTVVPAIMIFGYVAELCLSFLMIISICYFSNLDIAKFAKLNFCQKMLSVFTKCIPNLIILTHYFILILLIAQVFLLFVVPNCTDAPHTDPQTGDCEEGKMQQQGEGHLIVCCAAFIALHFCGGIARRTVYSDSFLYQPEMPEDKCKNILCVRIGP